MGFIAFWNFEIKLTYFNYFSYFFQKTGFDIHANCLLWRCHSIISWKNKRNISLSSAEFSQRAFIPYLTLWDKISEIGSSGRQFPWKFKSHRIFRPFYNRFYEEININQMLLWFPQASYMKKKSNKLQTIFRELWNDVKENLTEFIKSPLNLPYLTALEFMR